MDNDILRDYECGLETNIPWKIPHYGEHNIITKKGNKDSLIWNAACRTNNYNHAITRGPNVNVNANANANASIMGSYVIKKKNRRKSINNLHYPYSKFVNYILEDNGNNINNNKTHNNHNNGKDNHYKNDSIICNENDANLDFNKMLESNQNFTMNTKEVKNSLSISTKDESEYIWQNQPTTIYKLDNIKKYKRDQSSIAYYDFNTDNSDNRASNNNNNNNNSNRTMANNNHLFPILYDRYEYGENGKDKNNTVDSEQEETGLDLEQLLSCDTVDSLLSPDSSCNYKYDNYSYNSNGDLSYVSNLLSPIEDNNNLNNNCNNSNNNNLYDNGNNDNNNKNDNNLLGSNNYRNINIFNKEISTAVDITELLKDTKYF